MPNVRYIALATVIGGFSLMFLIGNDTITVVSGIVIVAATLVLCTTGERNFPIL